MYSLNIFKDLKISFFVTAIIGAAFVCYVGIATKDVLYICLSMLILIIALICIYMTAVNRDRKIQKSLDNHVNVSEYINAYAKIYGRLHKDNDRIIILGNLLAGYLYVGDLDSAKLVFDKMSEIQESNLCYYHSACASYYRIVGEFEKAKDALSEIKKIAEDNKNNTVVCKRLVDSYLLDYHQLLTEIDANYNAIPYFSIIYSCVQSNLNKVKYGYYYAQCLLKKGDTELAQDVLKTVAIDGGDTFYAREAALKLKDFIGIQLETKPANFVKAGDIL